MYFFKNKPNLCEQTDLYGFQKGEWGIGYILMVSPIKRLLTKML